MIRGKRGSEMNQSVTAGRHSIVFWGKHSSVWCDDSSWRKEGDVPAEPDGEEYFQTLASILTIFIPVFPSHRYDRGGHHTL